MKLVVAILADIHLTDAPSHPFSKRIDLVGAAIGSAEVAPDGIVIILGGDIADKGLPVEFAAMTVLLSRLRTSLSVRFPGVAQYFVSVPGNHDLLHPKDSEGYRQNLIDGSISTLGDDHPNAVYLAQLLQPQESYHEFARTLDVPFVSEHARVCETLAIPFGSHTLRLNLINTALLSQLHERQGSLLLPIQLMRRALENGQDSSLSLTIMHHPLYWIASTTLLELRELFGRTSDYVLTGHQHFASGFEESNDLGPNIKYYESPAFYDPLVGPHSSAFRVIVFDLEGESEKQLIFRWKNDRYVTDSAHETNFSWAALVKNRSLRPHIRMNLNSLEQFNNPGFAYIHKHHSHIGLADLFVYPDLTVPKQGAGLSRRVIPGSNVIAYLMEPGVSIVHGSPLSGKTSLSKKMVLDVRSYNSSIPVWIDGAAITAASIEDFEDKISASFRDQYSAQQLDSFRQLLPSQRVIIIDNWHLARIPDPLRHELYKWLLKFSITALLFVDQVYQVKELIATSPAEGLLPTKGFQDIRRVNIAPLSNVSKAALIHKWLRARGGSDPMLTEESREAKRVEDLVSTLLGKDSLPPYAFFVLCILQALESKKTAALAGGSFGPLFEILIFSALEKTESDDLEISTKLVFMQEIAFYMWTKRLPYVSRKEIDAVASAFTARNFLSMPVSQFLEDLENSKFLAASDGNYSFSYPHYFYYCVARYIRDHIEDSEADDLRAYVDEMIDRISSIENLTIVMFLIYFEKDKHRIISRLAANAARIYYDVPPARLEKDSKVFESLRPMIGPPAIQMEPDIAKNRHEARVFKDERDVLRSTQAESEVSSAVRDGYGYDEGLSDSQKLHLSQQTIIALGQVIRNFSANLEGARKVEVLKQTYLLGLRSLGRVMQIFGAFIGSLSSLTDRGDSELSVATIRIKLDQALTALTQLYALVVFENISNNIGVMNMEMAYTAVLGQLERTVAVRMIDITVQLHHFSAFPAREITELHADLSGNAFALGILHWLVGFYLTLHRVDPKTQSEMVKLFRLSPEKLEAAKT